MREKGATNSEKNYTNNVAPAASSTNSKLRLISAEYDMTTNTVWADGATSSKHDGIQTVMAAETAAGGERNSPKSSTSSTIKDDEKKGVIDVKIQLPSPKLPSLKEVFHEIVEREAAQQVHVISSDDDLLSLLSEYAQSGFAGFSSHGAMSPEASPKHDRKRSSHKPSNASDGSHGVASLELAPVGEVHKQKRSSILSVRGSAVMDADADVTSPRTAQKRNDAQQQHLLLQNQLPMNPYKKIKHHRYDVANVFSEVNAALANYQTPDDQIVEINSNSTSKSQKQKRLQLNSTYKLHYTNLNQLTPATNYNANNKCSTESTSEFPVSSPSNPQARGGFGGGGDRISKFPQRPALLKNTLPADSFERSLADIAARNPQMTLHEKMQAWQCDADLSDVEDVNNFDDLFKNHEEQKRKILKAKKVEEMRKFKGRHVADCDNYDFKQFRAMMHNYMITPSLPGGAGTRKQNRAKEKEKPSTSSAALLLATQRRLKSVQNEKERKEKRCPKPSSALGMVGKKAVESTTPPASSSSEDGAEGKCIRGVGKKLHLTTSAGHYPHPKNTPQKIHIYEKVLCPSSSEEASQDATAHNLRSTAQNIQAATAIKAATAAKHHHQQQQQLEKPLLQSTARASAVAMAAANEAAPTAPAATAQNSPSKPPQQTQMHCIPTAINADEESFFKLHRRNREIDKTATSSSQPQRLIQMRLDFCDEKKDLNLKAKASELFKTPSVPSKYWPTTSTNMNAPIMDPHLNTSNSTDGNSNKTNKNQSNASFGPLEGVKDSNSTLTGNFNEANDAGPSNAAATTEFHQQHEFCNYLGLTGMSTANAVANAVAELAKCNMTRRSLRVRHIQQLEKRAKSAQNEEKEAAIAAKVNQLLKQKRQKGGYDINHDALITKRYDHKDAPKGFLRNLPPPVNGDSQPTPLKVTPATLNFRQRDPEIKILSQFGVNDKDGGGDNPFENAKANSECSKGTATTTSTKDKADNSRGVSSAWHVPERREQISQTFPLQPLNQSVEIKHESVDCDSQDKEETDAVSGAHAAIDQQQRVQVMRSKFQKYLEDSRATKPSIYIVQSLCNADMQQKSSANVVATAKTLTESTSTPERLTGSPKKLHSPTTKSRARSLSQSRGSNKITIRKGSQTAVSRSSKHKLSKRLPATYTSSHKKKERLQRLLTRSALSLSHQRQLRSRKSSSTKGSSKRNSCKIKGSSEKSTCKKKSAPMLPARDAKRLQAAIAAATKSLNVFKTNAAVAEALNESKNLSTTANEAAAAANAILVSESQQGSPSSQHSPTRQAAPPNSAASPTHSPARHSRSISPLQTFSPPAPTAAQTPQVKPLAAPAEEFQSSEKLLRKLHRIGQRKPIVALRQLGGSGGMRKSLRPTPNSSSTNTGVGSSPSQKFNLKVSVSAKVRSNSGVPPPPPPPSRRTNIYTIKRQRQLLLQQKRHQHGDNDPAVVSSTTTSFDDAILGQAFVPSTGREHSAEKKEKKAAKREIKTCDTCTQSNVSGDSICYLSPPSLSLRNPLKDSPHGVVLYIYYELDVLIVVQEECVSFWKYCKLINMLAIQQQKPMGVFPPWSSHSAAGDAGNGAKDDTAAHGNEWTKLGECRRLPYDTEIYTPYKNRICIHNSMPIYVEMRCREVPRERRDCSLLSMYINIYYFNEEDLHAKTHSIQLDAVQSLPTNVVYTTITESRYFVMAWPQENILGKLRTGLCKYSLTPHLDTLASIREFKNMRHELRQLECIDDDKLLGMGKTQVTIWDHRSGDVLMNYDLNMSLGRHLGSIFYPCLEIGQNNMILLFQFLSTMDSGKKSPQLLLIACNISHTAPSHRVLQRHNLPTPNFSDVSTSVNIGEHLVVVSKQSDEELWISCTDPNTISRVPAQGTQRFYTPGRMQLIQLSANTLTVDSFANHVLKMAAGVKLL